MNSQPCCGVNLSRPTIPLVTPVFWNTGALPYATTLNISRQDDDIHSAILDILVCESLISLSDLLQLLP